MFRATREVDNPMLTDGLAYSGQRNAHLRVSVEENAMTRIGALCYIRKREDHHERAAAEFKSLYEARYGGQGGAMDPSRVKVDTSPIAHDAGMAGKIDRTVKLEMAMKAMDKTTLDRLVACIVLGVPCGEGRHWRTRAAEIDAVLSGLETVAVMWGISMKRAA